MVLRRPGVPRTQENLTSEALNSTMGASMIYLVEDKTTNHCRAICSQFIRFILLQDVVNIRTFIQCLVSLLFIFFIIYQFAIDCVKPIVCSYFYYYFITLYYSFLCGKIACCVFQVLYF